MPSASTFRKELDAAIRTLPPEVIVSDQARELMEQHWRLVLLWNQRTNLTAITDDSEAAWLHYGDSLQALPLLEGQTLVDFGSGAGFPGIPLAIARPDLRVALVEPRRKRASFLEASVARLGLSNVRVLEGRAEDAPDRLYATGVTRATFSELGDLSRCLAWLEKGGRLIAYRAEPDGEGSLFSQAYELRGARRYLVVWGRPLG